jgi:hypothetical protein
LRVTDETPALLCLNSNPAYCKWQVQPVTGLAANRFMTVKGSGLLGTDESVYAAAIEAGAHGFHAVIDTLESSVIARQRDTNPMRINTFTPKQDTAAHLEFRRHFKFPHMGSALDFLRTSAARATGKWYIDRTATTEDVGIGGDDMWLPHTGPKLPRPDQLPGRQEDLIGPQQPDTPPLDGDHGTDGAKAPTTLQSPGRLAPAMSQPPKSIKDAATKDGLLSELVRLAANPNTSHHMPTLSRVHYDKQPWTIPAALVGDIEALNWLHSAIPTLGAGVIIEGMQIGAQTVQQTLAEALAIASSALEPDDMDAPVPEVPRQTEGVVASGSRGTGAGTASSRRSASRVDDVQEMSVVGSL